MRLLIILHLCQFGCSLATATALAVEFFRIDFVMKLDIAPHSPLRKKNFCFGVATAAFQIEGGSQTRDRNIWDTFCAKNGAIRDNSNGDIACNHYELWQEDLELIAHLGVDAYRFSISWGRVVDAEGNIKPQGVQFYLNILKRLKSLNIKAYVTLYHWDLPQYLEDEGGWLNRETAYKFAHYADVISKELGDYVFSWATLNEPFCSAYLGYEVGIHAPGKIGREYGKKAAHHLLLAHGLAMVKLRKNCPNSESGIVVNVSPRYGETDSREDQIAARLADEHFNQWYISPLLTGEYPNIIEQLPEQEKPEIFPGDLEIIAAKLDYLGINYYTRERYVADPEHGFKSSDKKPLALTDMGWEVYPQGLTDILVQLHEQYQLPPIYITENGAAMPDKLVDGAVKDKDRLAYYRSHLHAVEDAMAVGVDIRAYFAWSLMDNFEWAEGYLKRFGIVYVDYQSQKRIIKQSGLAYREFLLGR